MRKNEQVCARVMPETMESLRAVAEEQSMLLSEFVRRTRAEKVNELTAPKASNEAGSSDHRVADPGFRHQYR